MPDATFLHIQTRQSATSQVLELTGVSIRVGRGPQCEVRLDDANLAEVQCVFRRRGSAWFIQPAGPTDQVTLAGNPVDRQRPWPPGAVLRVGSHWLSLRTHSQAKTATLGSFERPIEGTLFSAAAAELRNRAAAHRIGSAKEPTPGLIPVDPPKPNWSEAFEGHRRFLRDRKRERPWQSKWRSVGETLRAQLSARRAESPAPSAQPADSPGEKARSDRIEPPKFFLPGPRPLRPDGSEAGPFAPTPITEDVALAWPVGDPKGAVILPERTIEPIETTTWDEPGFRPIEPAVPESEPPIEAAPAPETSQAEFEPLGLGESPGFVESLAFVESADLNAFETELPLTEIREGGREHPNETEPEECPSSAVAPAEIPPVRSASGIEPPAWPGTIRFVADTSPGHTFRSLSRPDPPPSRSIRERGESHEWPSVLDILQQHGTRCEPRRARPSPRPGRNTRLSLPTASRPPRLWRMPRRLVIVPAFLATLLLSAGALRLSWSWMWDDRAAAIASNHLLANETLPRKPIPLPELPGSAWWMTTAPHLMMRAAILSQRQDDPAVAEDVRGLLDSARSAAPLDPGLRFARVGSGIAHLGLSRDVITLHETGRRLLQAGRKAAALKAYHAALEQIAQADSERAPIPPYFEDAQTRRFGMPNEAHVGSLLRDLIVTEPGRDALTFEEWSSSLPRSAVVLLAAYRICLDRNSPDADRAFALFTDQVGRQPVELLTPIENAAAAEALALKGRFDEASERYQSALDAEPNPLIRRTWSLNLAEIQGRLGRRREMNEAWEETRGPDPDDPINQRLVEARQRHGGNTIEQRPTPEAAPRDGQVQRAGFPQ